MRRTITYQTAGAAVTPQASPAPEPRATSELGAKVRTALVAGLVRYLPYFLILEAGWVAASVLWLGTPGVVVGIGVVAVLGLYLLGCVYTFAQLTYDWALDLGQYDWDADRDEREWKRHWEQDERDWQRQQLAESRQLPQVSPADRLPITAFTLLTRHYGGQPTAREACEEAGVLTQADWNLANAAFKALGWRNGRTLNPGASLETAWADWEARMRIYTGHVQVRRGNQWHEVEA